MPALQPDWHWGENMTDEDRVQQAIENVIEKRHGFPAGCGYTDAWIEREREAITKSFLRLEALLSLARSAVSLELSPLAGFIWLFVP